MKFGIQLFGVLLQSAQKGLSNKDVLSRLSGMGYACVEPCIAIGDLAQRMSDMPSIWSEEQFAAYEPTLRELGLTVESCHAFAEDIADEETIARIVALARRHGIRQIVLNCPNDVTTDAYNNFVCSCDALAAALADAGSELLLHSGAGDCAARLEGQCAYEWLAEHCDRRVGLQPDVGWLMAGGVDPVAFLKKHADRVRSVHYKDFTAEALANCGKPHDIQPGLGALDFFGCFQLARLMGVRQLVDQDGSDGDMLADAQAALRLLEEYTGRRDGTHSELCVLDTHTGEVTPVRRFDHVIEAPNWIQGEEALVYNDDGRLWRYDLTLDSISPIDTGECDNCNNDHVLSPDGRFVAVSHSERSGWQSKIYIVPITGGAPRLVTPNSPSFLHGWSPDGRELAYCAFREHDGKQCVDVYAIDAQGGEERRLTQGEGFSDGPEYAPDGRSVWFNSTRGGLMQLWRMARDGSDATYMTPDERNSWFAHLSPDGEQVAYIAYRKGELEPHEHLPNMNVELRLMNADGSAQRKLIDLVGGQGSMNVNSWASDSRRLAFVRYMLI